MKLGKLHLVVLCAFCLLIITGEGIIISHLKHKVNNTNAMVGKLLEDNTKLERQVEMLKSDIEIERTYRQAGYAPSTTIMDDVPEGIMKAVTKYANMYRLPPELVLHVIKRESNFNPRAVSSVGAAGLMQIYVKYHKDKLSKLRITPQQVYDINHNVQLGCWILRDYLNETGSIDKALTRYVGGKHPSYVKDILVGYTNETLN